MNSEPTKDVRKGMPSASGIKRLFLCPGSWQAEQKCPESLESEASQLGTYLHKCMELGTEPESPEDQEAIAWCREQVAKLEGDILHGTVIRMCEQRMFDKHDTFSGQPDYVGIAGDTALVIDYKFGRVPVDKAQSNLQLASLAVLVRDNYKVDNVYVAILQPYAPNRAPLVCTYAASAVESARQFINACIIKAQSPTAPLKPSEEACRYCKALASCPAARALVTRNTILDLDVAWESWTPERRRDTYEAAQVAKKFIQRVEEHMRADLEAGVEIPGLELAPGRKTTTITDAGAVFALLNGTYPTTITAEAFTDCCKVSNADLQKLVHEARKATDPSATIVSTKEWLRTALEPFCDVKVSAGTIKSKK